MNVRKIVSRSALIFVGLLVTTILGFLYFVLYTNAGTNFALNTAKSLTKDLIVLEVDLKSGSVATGLHTGKVVVGVPNVVTVTADSLDLEHTGLFDVIARNLFHVTLLQTTNLKVALEHKVGNLEDEEEIVEEIVDPNAKPFRLNFPVNIVIDKLDVNTFDYVSDIVDINIKNFDATLLAKDDGATMKEGVASYVTVHLKDDILQDGQDSEENKAVAQNTDSIDNKDNNKESNNSNKALDHQEMAENKTELVANNSTSQSGKATQNTYSDEALSLDKLSESLEDGSGQGNLANSDIINQGKATFMKKFYDFFHVFDPHGLDNNHVYKKFFNNNDITRFNVEQKQHKEGSVYYGNKDNLIEILPDVLLPLDVDIISLKIENGRYHQSNYDTGNFDVLLSASWKDTLLSVKNILAHHNLGDVTISGTMLFENFYDMDFKIEGSGRKNESTKNNYDGILYGLAGSGIVKGNLTDLSLDSHLVNPNDTHVTCRINALNEDVSFDFSIDSQYLSWPMFEQKPIATVSGLSLKAHGGLMSFLTTDFTGKFSGYGFENFKASFKGDIALDNITAKEILINGKYDNKNIDIYYQGAIELKDELSFIGTLNADLDDAGVFYKYLKGPFSLDSQFAMVMRLAKNPAVFVDINHVQSKFYLNGEASDLKVNLVRGVFGRAFFIDELRFLQKDNHIALKGFLNEKVSNVTGTLTLANLKSLSSQAFGNFLGSINISGPITDLNINVNARSKVAKFGGATLRNLTLNSYLRTGKFDFGITALAGLMRLSPKVKPSRQCVLDLSGQMYRHRFNFNCGGENSGYLAFHGNLSDDASSYSGVLTELVLSNELGGSLSLEDDVTVDLDLNNMTGTVSNLVLDGDIGSVSITDTIFNEGDFSTRAKLEDVDLGYSNYFLPEGTALKGHLNLESDISYLSGALQVFAELNGESIVFVNPSAVVPFKSINAKLDLNDERLLTDFDCILRRNLGKAHISTTISDPTDKGILSGDIVLEDLSLSVIHVLTSAFNDLNGVANIDGKISGTLNAPEFYGQVRVNGEAEPRYDIGQIGGFDIKLNAHGSSGELSGFVNLNEENVDINGSLDWKDGAYGKLSIKAHMLPTFLLGYGQAFANIDVTAGLSDVLELDGSITIPEAIFTIKGLTSSGDSVSKDEIVIGEGGTSALMKEVSKPIESKINLMLSLGDNVTISAMGLEAHVVGGVHVLKDIDDKIINSKGQISLVNGKIILYGHHFTVVKANTDFDGNIVNPALDVEVIADPDGLEDDVEVGVRVTGMAQDPRISLFSKPSMSQNEILSYILYGHGLEKASANQDTSSASLLLGLGLSSTTGFVDSLVGAFGLQDVQIGTSGSGDDTQVSVQGYLTRNIKISYGYGVFSAVGEFKLRYELVRKLYAEFISSADQAVDLVYSFEFD